MIISVCLSDRLIGKGHQDFRCGLCYQSINCREINQKTRKIIIYISWLVKKLRYHSVYQYLRPIFQIPNKHCEFKTKHKFKCLLCTEKLVSNARTFKGFLIYKCKSNTDIARSINIYFRVKLPPYNTNIYPEIIIN